MWLPRSSPVEKPNCLALLLTNPAEHSAKCGGPFEMDTGSDSLVKPPECHLFAEADFAPFELLLFAIAIILVARRNRD